MSPEDFEFAVAVAGASIGLAAVLLFAIVTILGTWRILRHVGQSSEAATRASLAIEELARRLDRPQRVEEGGPETPPTEEFGDLRQQAQELMDHQTHLQETVRNLIESGVLEGAPPPESLQNLEQAVQRLEGTVSEMAAAVANLMQQAERE
jgi:methyl-accepting chemotaxis protein